MSVTVVRARNIAKCTRRCVLDAALLASIMVSAALGSGAGLLTGLVPGLHMNNFAAVTSAYGSAALASFGLLSASGVPNGSGLAVSCFICSALVAHLFSESVVSTYVGVPSEDVVSVLPAHRLAKAGLGTEAVRASADGALAGVLVGACLVFPTSALMGYPVFAYEAVTAVMPVLVTLFIALLLASEARASSRSARRSVRVASASAIFMASGVLGSAVLSTDFYAAPVPDFSWMPHAFVPKSSLLLPMFAGFFGVSSLVLSMGSRGAPRFSLPCSCKGPVPASVRSIVSMLVGGIMVGWLPGMTSGSAAAACSPGLSGSEVGGDVESASKFIWLYSATSASGAVMSVGALFVIGRARSGSMDAVSYFMGGRLDEVAWFESVHVMAAVVLSMVLSAMVCRFALRRLLPVLTRASGVLCSRALAGSSLAFVVCLCLAITGLRGALVLACASCLGVLAPLAGVRRIQLMGSLLVPIWILFALGP